MANEREPISLSFGIDETLDTASALILDSLHSDDSAVSADPEEVENITETKPTSKAKTPPKKVLPTEESETEEKEELNLTDAFLEAFEKDGEESEEESEEDKKEEESEEKEQDVSIWTSLSNDLYKIGLFSTDEDEDGNETFVPAATPEQFKERFIVEMKKGVHDTISNFIGRYGDDYQDAFQAIYVDGVNPKTYWQGKLEVENLKDLDLSDKANQALIVRKALIDQGFEKEEADDEVTRLDNYGDLEKLAQRYHKLIAKKEETKLTELAVAKQAEIQKQQQLDEQYENNVFKILQEKWAAKDFDGIPVTKSFAEKSMDYLTTKKYKLPSGELLTDFDKDFLDMKRPENHSLKVKYGMLLQLLKTDPTLSTLTKRAESKKTNQVFDEVARHTKKSISQSNTVKTKKKSFFD